MRKPYSIKKYLLKNKEKDSLLSPNELLEYSMDKYQDVLIVGYDKDGSLLSDSSTNISNAEALWLVKAMELQLLERI